MDKKKKRASFTMDSAETETPSKNEKKVEQEPPAKQVVKVVIEEEIIKAPSPKHILATEEVIIKQQPVTDELPVIDGVDELPQKELGTKVNEFLEDEEDDEESTVTASATPDGESVLVTEEVEDFPVSSQVSTTHKKVVPAAVAQSIVSEIVDEPIPSQPEETDPVIDKQEVETPASVTAEEKKDGNSPPMTIHKGSNGSETTERQQEQVAELFNKNASANMPEITVHQQNSTRGVILWAVTMIAIALGVGGGLVLFTTRNNNPPSSNQAVVSPTPVAEQTALPSATPTPTPVAVNREDVSVQVLNGGGNSGAGSRMEEFLVDLGYTVSDVSNADAYTYDLTVVVTKPSNTEVADILEADLSGSYELDESVATLPEDSEFDAQVIVGANE